MKLLPVLLLALSASACTYVPLTGNGNQPDVVMICHKGTQELEVPSSAAAEHRQHGDTYGRCR